MREILGVFEVSLVFSKRTTKRRTGNLPIGPECTTPSHSQSLANFVANVHSQGISPQRERFFSQFHSQIHSHSLANSFATLNSQAFFFEIWWRKFASEFSGRVRIRIRIRNCIAATAVHSKLDAPDFLDLFVTCVKTFISCYSTPGPWN